MGNASSDSGGGNDSSSSCGGGISSEAIDRCVNTITLDNGGSINCRTGEISSYSLNDAIGHTPSNSSLDRNDEDRSTYSSGSSYDRQFVKDCYRSEREAYDKHFNTIDLGNGNSYNNRTGEFSYNSLSGVIGKNAVVVGVSVEQQKTQLLRKIKEHTDLMIKQDCYLRYIQFHMKIAENKAGRKLELEEYIKICDDAKTKYYTEPVKQSTPVPIKPNSTLNRIESKYVASAQARVNAVNLATTAVSTTARAVANVATAVGNAYIQGSNDMANTRRMEAQATQQLVSNVASAVGNAYSRGSMDMANTRRMEAQATQQLVSNVATAVVNNAPQVIRETAQGVSSFGFEVATQVASGLHTTNLMISGANEALSSINNREKGVVETTGEAVATGVATYVGGQVGSVIATGLLVKTAIETNMNVVGNIIQEEMNKYQQGGV